MSADREQDAPICACPDDDCRETCPVCVELADAAPCAAQVARQDAPVSGEGLTEAERHALRGLGQGQVPAAVERILAAREAAWAEKYAAAVGERDRNLAAWRVAFDAGIFQQDRADAVEAALATALREKAEDRARVDAVEALADEKERRIAEINAEPDPLTGRHSTMAAFALTTEIRAALANPTATGDE